MSTPNYSNRTNGNWHRARMEAIDESYIARS
jgi:hypothetical protein